MARAEERDGVRLTNLDEPLLADEPFTKRDLVDYLDAVADRLVPVLAGRPLSVIRSLRGQQPFMQKNLASYAPDWLERVTTWAASSHREVTYPLCNDRRALLWLANQRAVEFHPALVKAGAWDEPSHLVLDIDPPAGSSFEVAVAAAGLVREALAAVGLDCAVKTSGVKGLHVVVPVTGVGVADAAAATRALAARAERLAPRLATTAFLRQDREGKVFLDATRVGSATVVAAYSPRVRPGLPVSLPLAWEDLGSVTPGDFTLSTTVEHLAGRDLWAELLPAPQPVPSDLAAEGRLIPVARVQAMHEGKRRRRARHEAQD